MDKMSFEECRGINEYLLDEGGGGGQATAARGSFICLNLEMWYQDLSLLLVLYTVAETRKSDLSQEQCMLAKGNSSHTGREDKIRKKPGNWVCEFHSRLTEAEGVGPG